MNTPVRQVFDAEQARLVATYLPPAQLVEFQRLAKTLVHGPAFQLLFVDCHNERLQVQVLASLGELQRQVGLRGIEVALDAPVAGDISVLETRLIETARDHDVIHLLGASVWMDDVAWQSFNLVRERLATHVRVRLIFWLNEASIARIARHAADIWAWRGGIYSFFVDDKTLEVVDFLRLSTASVDLVELAFDSRSMQERHQRISEIRSMLNSVPAPSDDLRVPLLKELVYIQKNFGKSQEVIDLVEKEILPLAERLASHRLLAEAWTYWADAKNSLGDLDSALQVYRETILPILVSRSDVRDVAMIQGRIAGVLQARGDLGEALRTLREEELPVYERLGDVRSRAVTVGKIADVLQARGDLEEALRTRREEELPMYERLGDVRSRAVTMGKIADVLQARGDLEEALRTRREELLPVFEKLGDVRSRAVTMGKIADVLQARGNLEEALSIYKNDVLPVFERLEGSNYFDEVKESIEILSERIKLKHRIKKDKFDAVRKIQLRDSMGVFVDGAKRSRQLRQPRQSRWLDRLHLRLDQVMAALLLLLFSPVFVVVALMIWRNDGAPILFGHYRIGQHGKLFRCLKFRSMYRDSDAMLRDLLEKSPEARAEWHRDHKLLNDPRITPIGNFLRRTSLDELPQLFNVLRGEMSLVGPRPITLAELPRYGQVRWHYLSVRPGMTELWQVSGRNDTTYEERVELDRVFVEMHGLRMRLIILMHTLRVIFGGTSAYEFKKRDSSAGGDDLPNSSSQKNFVEEHGLRMRLIILMHTLRVIFGGASAYEFKKRDSSAGGDNLPKSSSQRKYES